MSKPSLDQIRPGSSNRGLALAAVNKHLGAFEQGSDDSGPDEAEGLNEAEVLMTRQRAHAEGRRSLKNSTIELHRTPEQIWLRTSPSPPSPAAAARNSAFDRLHEDQAQQMGEDQVHKMGSAPTARSGLGSVAAKPDHEQT
jgi:hypothetical protein